MSRVLWISVTRQLWPGARVSPGVAQRAFQSTPSSRTRPVSSAETGQHFGLAAKAAVAVGGGRLLAQPLGQRLESRQTQDADHDEHHGLNLERRMEQTAQQGCGTARREPDGHHAEGHPLQHEEPDRCNEPENRVDGHLHSLLLCLLYNKALKNTRCRDLRNSFLGEGAKSLPP